LDGAEQKHPHLAGPAYRTKYGQEVKVGEPNDIRFGHRETVIKHDLQGEQFEKIIELTDSNYYFDYEQQAKHVDEMTKFVKGTKDFTHPNNPSLNITCDNIDDRGTDDHDA